MKEWKIWSSSYEAMFWNNRNVSLKTLYNICVTGAMFYQLSSRANQFVGYTRPFIHRLLFSVIYYQFFEARCYIEV